MAFGTAKEMQRTAALLDQIKGNLVDTYKTRTGQTPKKLADWMDAETWFDANDAVEHGFADKITAEQPVAACFDLKNFHNVPAAYKRRTVASGAGAVQRVRLHRQAERLHST